MSPVPYSLRDTWSRLGEAWNAFFHAPVDPRLGALLRIVYAALLLVNLSMWARDLPLWFGEQGVLPLEISRLVVDPWAWTIFQVLPTEEWVLWTCYGLFAAQTLLLLVGCCSRINAACVYVWLLSFQHRNVLIGDGEDTVFRLIGFCLIFLPQNEVWSVDAWLWPRRPEEGSASPWALRLLQIQMCVIYFSAACVKLTGERWLDGTALYYVARLDDYFGRFPTPHVLWETPWLVRLLSWSVIAVEYLVPLFVWFRETRRWALLAALVFHLGCEWTMYLFLFHWIMLCGWLAFLDREDLEAVAGWFGRGSDSPAPAAEPDRR